MKITICGSTAFIQKMDEVRKELEKLGHEVKMPPLAFTDGSGKEWKTEDYYQYKKSEPYQDPHFLKHHTERIQAHMDKVAWSDAVLITNWDKNGIANYIGPNTLMEMGVAFYLGKKIYLLNPIPDVAWKEEIIGMKPLLINGSLPDITSP